VKYLRPSFHSTTHKSNHPSINSPVYLPTKQFGVAVTIQIFIREFAESNSGLLTIHNLIQRCITSAVETASLHNLTFKLFSMISIPWSLQIANKESTQPKLQGTESLKLSRSAAVRSLTFSYIRITLFHEQDLDTTALTSAAGFFPLIYLKQFSMS
jgi:hypothetical protein